MFTEILRYGYYRSRYEYEYDAYGQLFVFLPGGLFIGRLVNYIIDSIIWPRVQGRSAIFPIPGSYHPEHLWFLSQRQLMDTIRGTSVVLLGIFFLVLGWGLWKQKKWGYQAAMVFSLQGIIVDSGILLFVLFFFLSDPNDFGSESYIVIPILLSSFIIVVLMGYYLLRPEVRDVFGVTGILR